MSDSPLPHPPLGEFADKAVDWIKQAMPELLQGIQDTFNTATEALIDVLTILPGTLPVPELDRSAAAALLDDD